MNFLNGRVEGNSFVMNGASIGIPESKLALLREHGFDGKDGVFGTRPKDIHDEPIFLETSQNTKIRALIEVAEQMGSEIVLYSQVANQEFVVRVNSRFNV